MPRKETLVFGSLVVALAVSVSAILMLRPHVPPRSADSFAYRAGKAAGELPVLWQAPEFSYPNQNGKTVTLAVLDGKVTIADFIFTQCVSVCPRITAKMVLLQHRIPDENLRFVSFSVDPAHDTPEVLAKYQAKWNAKESRWLLLSTQPDTLSKTVAGMRVAVQKTDSGTDPIIHSSMFFLIDQKRQVRGIYSSEDDTAVDRLMKDAHELAGGKKPVAPSAVAENASGAELYAALDCAACHEDKNLAPSLHGISGRDVELEGGSHVTANAAYIKESIVAPGEKIVAGFLGLMPSYGGHLSDAQLDRLVAYVAALAPAEAASSSGPPMEEAPAGTPVASIAVDPVCGMNVRVTDTARHAEHDGKTFYFCSDSCRDRFLKDPAAFEKKK
jgi:protein SCO1/2